ncbi:MAG: beta-hexosaminidase [Bacteroidales bacterium]|nr:beta-hexosaminidase [Bacteroidales bacterium]
MKNLFYLLICNLIVVALVILTSCGSPSQECAIVPVPLYMENAEGAFVIDQKTCISVEDESLRSVAEWFAGLFESSAGFVPRVCEDCPKADIRLHIDSTMRHESYGLYVGADGADIFSCGPAGFFYALQTVRAALPAELESDVPSPDVRWEVPLMTVLDQPRFEYRGLMVDVSRYFLPKENLLEIIDCMAMLKLNNLHLHLTDDNGWRIEIKKYPLLTQIGAWRADRGDIPFPDRHNPVKGEPTPTGGFYTQDDIREIVAYAAERYINVVPEIDMPAHSNSALAAYPEYACPVVDKYIGVLPGLGGTNADIIYCAGNDRVFGFLNDIIDEVCELFPSEYIHLGGDEAWKTYWKKCHLCQDRITDENLADEEALQGWFMSRMNDYLRSKGRTMMCWDEITNSVIPEGAVVYGWRGMGEAALIAAQRGHRFILTPSERLYLIRYQGPQWFEPLTYFGNSTLADVYSYEPLDSSWTADRASLLMGVQGSMWTEFCDCPEDVTYQIFPRLAALAEVAWSAPALKDWQRFLTGVDAFCRRLDHKAVVYSRSMYNIQHTVTPSQKGHLSVELECERPDVQIRYTLDGQVPEPDSPRYSGPFEVDEAVVVKAATFFADGSRAGEVLELPVGRNKATACKVYSGRPAASLLVNGVRGSLRQTDFEWCHFNDDAHLVIDLGEVTEVGQVDVGTLNNYGMAFHKPSSMSVSISVNGLDYIPAAHRDWHHDDIFREGRFREDIRFSFAAQPARYVKIKASHSGDCPEGHIREGQPSKYCFDEIVIRDPGRYKDAGRRSRSSDRSVRDTSSVKAVMADKSRQVLFKWATSNGM